MSAPETVHGQAAAADAPSRSGSVLFVDLDSTLTTAYLPWEGMVADVREHPRTTFRHLLDSIRGHLEEGSTGAQEEIDIEALPYRLELLNFLRQRRGQGWRTVLVTHGDEALARRVAAHLELFDDVIARVPQGHRGESGRLKALESYCERHQAPSFGYVGHRSNDLAIWTHADEAVLVAPPRSLLRRVEQLQRPSTVIDRRPEGPGLARALLRAMRPYQWAKNLLVFAALIFGHQLSNGWLVAASCVAFTLFCAMASAIYLLNDVLDVESDRRHPTKRHRPIAAGDLSIQEALVACVSLAGGSMLFAVALLPLPFAAVLLTYALTNLAYSIWLKRKVMIDIVLLASLYTLRIIAGGAATDIVPSEWLLALSMFVFLSLAMLKRYAELSRLHGEGLERTDRRGYRVVDLDLLKAMGPTCGCLAVLVLALYVNSPHVTELYAHPRMLWLACPILLYWIGRTWIWALRGAINEDPLMFALKDRTSWIVLLLVVVVGLLSL